MISIGVHPKLMMQCNNHVHTMEIMMRELRRLDIEMIRCVNHFSGRLLHTSGGHNNKYLLIGKERSIFE